jgi:hypothetical protein
MIEQNQGDCKGLRCIARAVAVGAVAVTIALFLLTAYLIGHAMAAPTPQQIAACGPDAQRLCAEFIPDGTAVKACLVRHRDQLSQSCKEVFPK